MKMRVLSLLLAALLLMGVLSACGGQTAATAAPAPTVEPTAAPTEQPTTREFTDSTGRTVTIPWEVTKIAVSGPLTQVYVLPLAGDMLVGVSNAFSEDAEAYLPSYIFDLTEIGQLYGGKGEMDLEALLSAAPDAVIDVGEAKDTIVDDMNSLSEQTGIPFVHIDATVATAPDAYRMLGELTGRTEKAGELAGWCEKTYADISAMMEKVDAAGARKTILYLLGDKGCNVLAKGSFHAETVNLMGDNLADIADVTSSGMGNEVDMEQILAWNPQYIIFSPDSVYASAAGDPAWQQLTAVQNGKYFETPYGPYGWLSSPPAVQRYLGMVWLGALLYPDYADYDLQSTVTEYYKLFYGCDLTADMYDALTANAMPRT